MTVHTGLVEFGWTFIFQIVNTIVIFLILKKILFKPVREFMLARQKGIEDSIKEADSIHAQAETLKIEYEQKLENIKEEGREIIKDARVKADEHSKDIIKQAQDKAAAMIKHAEEEVVRENVKAMNQLKDQIAALALVAAEKILEKEIDENQYDAMIKKFVEEVGEAEWQN